MTILKFDNMNQETMDIIEDAISQGIWDWLEFNAASDSLYFEFFNLKLSSNLILGPDSYNGEFTIRFGEDAYLAVYYNGLDDFKFLNLDEGAMEKVFDENIQLSEIYPYFFRDLSQKVLDFKFQDYDFLDDLNSRFENRKVLLGKPFKGSEFDFLLAFTVDDAAVVAGGNSINFFNDSESLNDDDIKKASNNWMVYYLKYWLNKGTPSEYKKDFLCEENPLK